MHSTDYGEGEDAVYEIDYRQVLVWIQLFAYLDIKPLVDMPLQGLMCLVNKDLMCWLYLYVAYTINVYDCTMSDIVNTFYAQ